MAGTFTAWRACSNCGVDSMRPGLVSNEEPLDGQFIGLTNPRPDDNDRPPYRYRRKPPAH